jgi:hypothetical protein
MSVKKELDFRDMLIEASQPENEITPKKEDYLLNSLY